MFNVLLFIGLAIGLFSVIFIVGLCRAAQRADRCLEQYDPQLLGNDPPQLPGTSATSLAVAHGKHATRA